MTLLRAGVDATVIALWLGHESPASTRVHLHADMALKENAIARTTPPRSTLNSGNDGSNHSYARDRERPGRKTMHTETRHGITARSS
jgi:hypothetical protein